MKMVVSWNGPGKGSLPVCSIIDVDHFIVVKVKLSRCVINIIRVPMIALYGLMK
uniref:Uncharacterized protein MANES_12G083300 n=1 Tax=Rhizophora mucronata TaxID=61149 RepID=A0A2P2MS15_RHIMU